ncbi:MAG: DNA-binding protein [Bdellovibrionales bacterium CG12_big_fil_rev_8_21_14_0_65_38_15]|nr:MAG: DNA-binding protein [Bdellovibrionales bacterium CG22_combo_CG10-13_8_21_14_all_38_13]PIQ55399.1 MAG: DNA-binding protein [Bdellovibrionales bacterium CG12_big_fil_rev_8_21_14_0_65_38_15]PIR28761.1 MAG: DNA-binding protein [Bdellovibrionales bacterium CG11_big_fil_rev_8_21_14_0_20_38_13]
MNDSSVLNRIEGMIYIVRGHRVMLDSDLAELYGVQTKVLNQSVKRNIERFPMDFMIQLTEVERDNLSEQSVSFKQAIGARKFLPYAFTENGVAMLSSVLGSKQAIQMNISIMRIFTKLRSFLLLEKELRDKMDQLERDTSKLFKVVFERLDVYEEMLTPRLVPNRKRIGLKDDE